MPLQTNKRILFYFFLFILLGTFNNQKIYSFGLPKINKIEIIGLEKKQNLELLEKLKFLKIQNLFFLDKIKIEEILDTINFIDEYFVIKKYPSSIKFEIIETKSLAYIKKNEKVFILGSNGKLFQNKSKKLHIPFIFGNFETSNFFWLKKIIDESKFNYTDIKNFYSFKSGRWDIEISSGILIKLPINGIEEAIDLSLEILNDDRFKDIKIIDLRQNQRIIINE